MRIKLLALLFVLLATTTYAYSGFSAMQKFTLSTQNLAFTSADHRT